MVYDYALDLIFAYEERIPDGTWTVIIENATGPELAAVGYSAQYLYHNSDMALRAWRNAVGSGHRVVASYANFNLGNLLAEQGEYNGARAAYQKAVDSGHESWAPLAMVSLGNLLAQQGDVAGARAAYQKAIDSGDAEKAANAWVRMGNLLGQQGDVAGARAAYQKAIDSGTPELGSRSPWSAWGFCSRSRVTYPGRGPPTRRPSTPGAQ